MVSLAPGGVSIRFRALSGFGDLLFVLWVAAKAPAYLAAPGWQLGVSDILGDLAQTRPVVFGEGLHALAAATISGLKIDLIFLLFLVFGLLAWPVLGILAPTDEILLGAALAVAGLAALIPDFGPPLALGHHADAGLLGSISMLTNFAALNY